jgi:hypothetical protein
MPYDALVKREEQARKNILISEFLGLENYETQTT